VRSRGLWIGLSVFIVVVGGTVWAVRATNFTFPPTRKRAFPGFDVRLPYGATDAEAKNYRKGRLTVSSIGSLTPSVDVRWEPGDLYGDEEIALAQKAMASELREELTPFAITSDVAIAGKNATRTWAALVGKRAVWTTQIACGVRRVTLTTLGGTSNAERVHRRTAGSFHCHPDAAQERTATQVPVVFDVGKGWFHQPSTDGDFRITNGHLGMIARPFSRVDPADIRQVIEAVMPSFKFGERVGDDWPISMDVDGEELRGWMTSRACPDSSHLLLMSIGEADQQDEARALLKRARCQRTDEPAQTFPDLPAPSGNDPPARP